MTVIVCAHRWEMMASFPRRLPESNLDKLAGSITHEIIYVKMCPWCKTPWKDNDPEPRVVIGRVEEEPCIQPPAVTENVKSVKGE